MTILVTWTSFSQAVRTSELKITTSISIRRLFILFLLKNQVGFYRNCVRKTLIVRRARCYLLSAAVGYARRSIELPLYPERASRHSDASPKASIYYVSCHSRFLRFHVRMSLQANAKKPQPRAVEVVPGLFWRPQRLPDHRWSPFVFVSPTKPRHISQIAFTGRTGA